MSICVCVLNFADDRRKFESDYQKASPLGDAPCSRSFSTALTCRGHPREINFLLTFLLAGLSEYPGSRKRQWFFKNKIVAHEAGAGNCRADALKSFCNRSSQASTRKAQYFLSVDFFSNPREKAAEYGVKSKFLSPRFIVRNAPADRVSAPAVRHSCSRSMDSPIFR